MEGKKRIFSAVQPSGIPTIGNYVGAIRNWVNMQDEYDCIYSVADLHTLTVKQVPSELRARTLELLALYLSCGIDPKKSVIFLQSHVHSHAELCWILNTITYPGELNRMTQYKDKSAKHADNVNMGLMDYPVLMAADILLYGADAVPIGKDQKQHLEIARDLAIRFNNRYSPTFVVPEGFIPALGSNIMSLQDPLHKMSKSDANENAYISMADDTDTIIRKFKRAVTDSDNKVCLDVNRPGISNLVTIYCVFTGKTPDQVAVEFENKGYGDFKLAVGDVVSQTLKPINDRKKQFLEDKAYLNEILLEGKQKAQYLADKMMNKVYRKVGLYQLEKK